VFFEIISSIALAISVISLYFTWRKTRKEQPIISHEVFSCKHRVADNNKYTNLEIVYRLHNRGDRGTRLNSIEVVAVDFNGEEHASTNELSVELDENSSTDKIRNFFYFAPPFPYLPKMHCKFIISHTHEKYSFKHDSEESEEELVGTHVGFA
jgi:hypothetical protein